jgi:tight adherence protein B
VTVSALLAAVGVVALAVGLWGRPIVGDRVTRRAGLRRRRDVSGWWWRLAVGAALGSAVWAITGWPAAGWWAGALAAWVPSLALRSRQRRAEEARGVAVARWAAMLRDQVLVGADVAQAIRGSEEMAPAPIAAAVKQLSARLQVQDSAEVLAAFADQVDDPMAEILAVSLRFALTRRTGKLADLLDEVARATGEQVKMRRAIEKDRRRLRTVVWSVLVAVTGWIVVIYVVSGSYLAPYTGLQGQAVMLLAGGAFAVGLVALSRMDRIGAPARLRLRQVP